MCRSPISFVSFWATRRQNHPVFPAGCGNVKYWKTSIFNHQVHWESASGACGCRKTGNADIQCGTGCSNHMYLQEILNVRSKYYICGLFIITASILVMYVWPDDALSFSENNKVGDQPKLQTYWDAWDVHVVERHWCWGAWQNICMWQSGTGLFSQHKYPCFQVNLL